MKNVIIIIVILLLIVGWIGWLQLSTRSTPPEEIPIAEEDMKDVDTEEAEEMENEEDAEEEMIQEETTEDKTKDITDEEKTTEPEEETEEEEKPITFIQCLADEGVVIYGMRGCPACEQLARNFGGYDAINLIYVECREEQKRCSDEMKTRYVPEIQIMGNLFEEGRTPQDLSWATGCEL